MIFICSSEKDITTNEVVRYLRINNKEFFRLNVETDKITSINIEEKIKILKNQLYCFVKALCLFLYF